MKCYYEDQLQAAWMARNFGVRFVGDCLLASFGMGGNVINYIPSKMTIYADDMKILEPREGDIGKDYGDMICEFSHNKWRYVANIEYSGDYPNEDEVEIILRGGIHFMWPQEEK